MEQKKVKSDSGIRETWLNQTSMQLLIARQEIDVREHYNIYIIGTRIVAVAVAVHPSLIVFRESGQ